MNEKKLARFEQAGIDEVVFLEFTQTFASLSPATFAEQILSKGLGLKEVFVGQHFAFGHKRAGRINDLTLFGHRFGFIVHPTVPVTIAGEWSAPQESGSSSFPDRLIRPLTCSAVIMLSGVVTSGERRGRTLGWPTANLRLPSDRVVPADGIYASITTIEQKRHDSISYIGRRPTFDSGERLLEVTILDGTYNLYGHDIAVEFIDRIRGDVHFDGVAALSQQIASDVDSAKTILRRHHEAIGG